MYYPFLIDPQLIPQEVKAMRDCTTKYATTYNHSISQPCNFKILHNSHVTDYSQRVVIFTNPIPHRLETHQNSPTENFNYIKNQKAYRIHLKRLWFDFRNNRSIKFYVLTI